MRTMLVPVLMTLISCSPQQGSGSRISGLSSEENASITNSVLTILRNRQYGATALSKASCSNMFTFSSPEGVIDASLNGSRGTVLVSVIATPTGTRPMNTGESTAPSANCLGDLAESSYSVGSPRTVTLQFSVEQWESGWRLARQQNTICGRRACDPV